MKITDIGTEGKEGKLKKGKSCGNTSGLIDGEKDGVELKVEERR